MKPTKKQADLISKAYNLGKVKSLNPIAGGWVNYNYLLETSRGKFVVRILGSRIKKETKMRLTNEFKILEYLHKNNFPYEIPYPIKNNEGKYLTEKSKQLFWVYHYLEGSPIKDYDDATIKSIAKALATYHQYVENVKINDNRKVDSLTKTYKKYKKMRMLKPDTPANKLVLENLGFFEESLKKIKKIKFDTKQVQIHYDFHKGNLLFDKKKVVGIIDFERFLYAPRILDITQLIKCTYKKDKKVFMERVNFIIKEYDKINPLTKREKGLILPMLARDNCRMFERFYELIRGSQHKKIHEGDLSCLKWTIDVQKLVMGAMR